MKQHIGNAIDDSIRRIYAECQNRDLWRTERDRKITIAQNADDFRRLGLPLPK